MSGDSVDIKGQIMNMTMLIMNMLTTTTTRTSLLKEFRLRALHVPLSTLTTAASKQQSLSASKLSTYRGGGRGSARAGQLIIVIAS